MAKAIYCLKIYFTWTKEEQIGIRDICICLAKLYLKVWIQAPMATKAPRLKLEFFLNFNVYQQVDEKISRIAIHKLCNHVWYLAPKTPALAIFDDDIGCDTKKRMVEALDKIDSSDNSVKKLEIFLTKGIENFISKKYNKIFCEIFHPDGFFTKRSSWMGR